MAVVMSSGNTSVTGNVTAVEAVANATPLSGALTPNATTVIGTVPANKKWTIISIFLQQDNTGAVVAGSSIRLNGVAAVSCRTNGLNTATISTAALNLSYGNGFLLTAGQTIDTVVAANVQGAYSIAYVEEAA